MLLEAMSPEGSGVLVRLHFRDSLLPGPYPVVMPGDSAVPGAVVAVRYLIRDASHAFFFDSGAVAVHRDRGRVSGRIDGSGVENAIRTPTRLAYRDVAMPARTDTMPCNFQP